MEDEQIDAVDVVAAIQTYIQRSTDERIARNAYDGYSWDWFGSALISETRQAEEKLKAVLEGFVDQRVEQALRAAGVDVPEDVPEGDWAPCTCDYEMDEHDHHEYGPHHRKGCVFYSTEMRV